MANSWNDPSIVDGIEHIRIGQNAEHFFFTYLQSRYGLVDVTPTNNWRSSSRLVIYPQCRRNVNDTRELFVRGSGSTTKHCYFEVKGTSRSFNEAQTCFHISQNELNTCETIANDGRRRDREAYFIVIIQNCLDAEKICFGTTINWSENFGMIAGIVDSYQCKIVPPLSTNINNSRSEEPIRYNNREQQQQQLVRSDGRSYNSTASSAHVNSSNSATSRYNSSSPQNQQQQGQIYDGRNGDNNINYQQTHKKR